MLLFVSLLALLLLALLFLLFLFGRPSPNTQPLNVVGSFTLVGIGKFNLLFLWLIGGVT